jgi:hypothetical protein
MNIPVFTKEALPSLHSLSNLSQLPMLGLLLVSLILIGSNAFAPSCYTHYQFRLSASNTDVPDGDSQQLVAF